MSFLRQAAKKARKQNGHKPEPVPEDVPPEPEPAAESIEMPVRSKKIRPWKPFPTNCLPVEVELFVTEAAACLGCDPSYVALPLLACLAGIVGAVRELEVKPGWWVRCILWTIIVGDSGTGKSPAFRLATSFLRELQRRLFAEFDKPFATVGGEPVILSGPSSGPFMSGLGGDGFDDEDEQPEREERTLQRVVTADTTVEALAAILKDNHRGVAVLRDELSGWFGSLNRYNGRKGADESFWLSCYNGEPTVIDRKMGEPKTIFLDSPCVSLAGGIQPRILAKAATDDLTESGMMARFLMAAPPREPKRWTDARVDATAMGRMRDVFNRLFAIEGTTDELGKHRPVTVHLSPAAKHLYVQFYNDHADEQQHLSGDLAAVWSKHEEVPLRLALVFHCIVDPDGTELSADVMQSAIELTRWFGHEARRLREVLRGETVVEQKARRILDWIAARQRPVTVRDVQQGCRWAGTAEQIERELESLVQSGTGTWEQVPSGASGGRPTRRFVLSVATEYTQHETPKTPGNDAF